MLFKITVLIFTVDLIILLLFFSYTVCREICLERGEFGQMFKYYLIDDSKKHQIFSFISSKPECFELLCLENVKVIYKLFVDILSNGKRKHLAAITKHY